MFQLEVKRWLILYEFPPSKGWAVTVDVDAMERANGGNHPPGKREIAAECEAVLRAVGARIVAHEMHGRADLVAERPGSPTYVVEVEGASSRQREQAMYSALGQLLVSMRGGDINTRSLIGCSYVRPQQAPLAHPGTDHSDASLLDSHSADRELEIVSALMLAAVSRV